METLFNFLFNTMTICFCFLLLPHTAQLSVHFLFSCKENAEPTRENCLREEDRKKKQHTVPRDLNPRPLFFGGIDLELCYKHCTTQDMQLLYRLCCHSSHAQKWHSLNFQTLLSCLGEYKLDRLTCSTGKIDILF